MLALMGAGWLAVGTARAQPSMAGVTPVDPLMAPMQTPVGELPATQSAAVYPSGGGYAHPTAQAGAAPSTASGFVQPIPASIDSDYKIGANDLLEIEVFGVEQLRRTVRVNSGGEISLPLIGLVPVAGLQASAAETLIEQRYGEKYLQDPQVSIFIKEFTSQRITVDGAVGRPGIYPLTGQMTLLRALAMAGGGASLSDLEHVMLFRIDSHGQRQSEEYDVDKIRTGEAPDPILRGDDVVVVNRNSARAALRDSLFSDILDTLNPFSSTVRNAAPR